MANYATGIATDFLKRRKDALRLLRHAEVRTWGRSAFRFQLVRRAASVLPWHRLIPFPPHISVELTNRCNLQCRMCMRFHAETRKLGTMEFDLFREIMDDAARSPTCDLLLTGFGEPLLHPQFDRCLEYATDQGIDTLRIITSGTLLTAEKADAILSTGVRSIHFSIDGNSSETYNNIRSGGDFDKTIENVTYSLAERSRRQQRRPQVVLRTIRMPETEHEIDSIKERWQALLADHDQIWVQELLLPDLENRAGREDRDTMIGARKVKGSEFLYPCAILWKRLGIRWNGDYDFCCAAGCRSDLGLGLRFQKMNLRQAWTHEGLNRIRRLHALGRRQNVNACRDCANFSFNAL